MKIYKIIVFILFIFFSVDAWGAIIKYEITSPKPGVFNYTTLDDNDCWDIDKNKEVCRNRYFYTSVWDSTKKKYIEPTCGEDPVCKYYKSVFNSSPRNACQWTGNYCAPIDNIAYPSYFTKTSGDTNQSSENTDDRIFIKGEKAAKDIIKRFMYLIEEKDEDIIKHLEEKVLSDTDVPRSFRDKPILEKDDGNPVLDFVGFVYDKRELGHKSPRKIKEVSYTVDSNATPPFTESVKYEKFNDHEDSWGERKGFSGEVSHGFFQENWIEKGWEHFYEGFLTDNGLKIISTIPSEYLNSGYPNSVIKPKYAVSLEAIDAIHFLHETKSDFNPEIISSITNLQRSTKGKLKDGEYKFYVISIKYIDWDKKTTEDTGIKFIYNDNYLTFVRVEEPTEDKYEIDNEIPESTKKYAGFCKEIADRFDINYNYIMATSILRVRILSKGDIEKAPDNIDKLASIERYCSDLLNFENDFKNEKTAINKFLKELTDLQDKVLKPNKKIGEDDFKQKNVLPFAEFFEKLSKKKNKTIINTRFFNVANGVAMPPAYKVELEDLRTIDSVLYDVLSAQFFIKLAINMDLPKKPYYIDTEGPNGWIFNCKNLEPFGITECKTFASLLRNILDKFSLEKVAFAGSNIYNTTIYEEVSGDSNFAKYWPSNTNTIQAVLNDEMLLEDYIDLAEVDSAYVDSAGQSGVNSNRKKGKKAKKGRIKKAWKWLNKTFEINNLLESGVTIWQTIREQDLAREQMTKEAELERMRAEMSADPCYAFKDSTEKHTVINPFTRKSEKRSLREICMWNEIRKMGQKGVYDECFQMMNMPQMFSQLDIRDCFRNLAGLKPYERTKPVYKITTDKDKKDGTTDDDDDDTAAKGGGLSVKTGGLGAAPGTSYAPGEDQKEEQKRRERAKSPFYGRGRYTMRPQHPQKTYPRDVMGQKVEKQELASKPVPVEVPSKAFAERIEKCGNITRVFIPEG